MLLIAMIVADINNLLSIPWWVYALAAFFGGVELGVSASV